VLNGLRSSGSVHGIGIADAIDNGTLDLTILPTDPSGRGARGSYGIGSNEIVLHADQFLSDQQAAGGAGHEGTHWFQDLTGQFVDQSGRLTYHRGLEFEAFLAQREIDPTHWANGLSDRSLMFKVKYLYPDVKPAPPVWTPTRY